MLVRINIVQVILNRLKRESNRGFRVSTIATIKSLNVSLDERKQDRELEVQQIIQQSFNGGY